MNKKKIFFVFVSIMLLLAFGCSKQSSGDDNTKSNNALYYCPMHPQVTSDKPGVCPICNMNLVKRSEANTMTADEITLEPAQEKLADIATMKVGMKDVEREVRAFASIEIPEDSKKIIAAKFNGRIERLKGLQTGERIDKGQLIMTAYSQDISRLANELASAYQIFQSSSSDQNKMLMDGLRRRMELAGLTSAQIDELQDHPEKSYSIEVHSPYSGIIIERKAVEGMYFTEGTTLFELADLLTVWASGSVFESDVSALKIGMKTEITFQSLPGKVFTGKINFISPIVDPQNKTVQIRVTLINSGMQLRPAMYGELNIQTARQMMMMIPQEAILFTGKRQIVWIKTGEHKYKPREIKVGSKSNNEYQVLEGLSEGDEILTSGAYLLDSESQLKGGSSSMPADHSGMNMNENSSSSEKTADDPHSAMNKEDQNSSPSYRYITKNDPIYKKLGIFNKVCPVLGEEVSDEGPMILYKNKIYAFCCAGCDKSFITDPEKFTKNLSADGTKSIAH